MICDDKKIQMQLETKVMYTEVLGSFCGKQVKVHWLCTIYDAVKYNGFNMNNELVMSSLIIIIVISDVFIKNIY